MVQDRRPGLCVRHSDGCQPRSSTAKKDDLKIKCGETPKNKYCLSHPHAGFIDDLCIVYNAKVRDVLDRDESYRSETRLARIPAEIAERTDLIPFYEADDVGLPHTDYNWDACVDRPGDLNPVLNHIRGLRDPYERDLVFDVNKDATVNIADLRRLVTLFTFPRGATCNPRLNEHEFWLSAFAPNAGDWHFDRYPRVVADVDGDGDADIVGFGNRGVFVALSTGTGFSDPGIWLHDFSYNAEAGEWRVEKHPRVMADVNNDKRADIVGFHDEGVFVSLSTGANFTKPTLWVTDFGLDAGDLQVDRHPRTMADVNGDGLADVVGFGNRGMFVALSTGTKFLHRGLLYRHFSYDQEAGGWSVNEYLRTMADINGDGYADIVGFDNDGVWIAIYKAHD